MDYYNLLFAGLEKSDSFSESCNSLTVKVLLCPNIQYWCYKKGSGLKLSYEQSKVSAVNCDQNHHLGVFFL